MKKTNKNEELSQDQLDTLVNDYLLNQKTFKDIQGITDKEMESIYATAYNFYTHGKLDRAKDIFSALCQMDPYQAKYWLGLGATRQMQEKYEKAVEAYGMATLMDIKNPLPSFYAAHCLMKLNDHDRTISALETVIEVCKSNKEHKGLQTQAEQLLEGLQKKSPQKETK
ncbi:MAG: CesD/SycD/LcrH family type III secretion system chaperone [Verrucomicrobia bacterium]|nr:MAG: CesD/SycD/LcrH family type III secretion system chaperone [Verrucomicrobiota bacterium]